MAQRVCGNCRWGKRLGDDGTVVCTHSQGRRFGVTTTECRAPRRMWKPPGERHEQKRLAI